MKREKIFIGVIALIFAGAAILYYVEFRVEGNVENEPSKSGRSVPDSLTESNRKRMPVEIGAKPEKNPKDGSIKIVKDFVRANAKNPATFKFLEWSDVSSEGGYWKVRCKYSGISSFNAEVTTNAWFYIRNNKVVYSKIISKI